MKLRTATKEDVETLFDIRCSVVENHQSREELATLGMLAAVDHARTDPPPRVLVQGLAESSVVLTAFGAGFHWAAAAIQF